MNRYDDFESLVRAAKSDSAPSLDVRASVLATLRARRTEAVERPERPPVLAAAMAVAVAILTLLPALQALGVLINPMTALVGAMRGVL